jgi:3-oxoacyl-[acyl-carrier-protein] synthase II
VSPDVWITGIGVISSAGIGPRPLMDVLRAGTCSASPCSYGMDQEVARCVGDVDVLPGFPDDRKCWLGHQAARMALDDAGLPIGGARIGVFLGTGLSSITPSELAEDVYPHLADGQFCREGMAKDLSTDRASPRRHMPSRLTSRLAEELGAGAVHGTSFSACSAAAQAIAEGMRLIRRGHADIAIVGGHDSMVHPMGILSFQVLGALSPSKCRPFDKNRDGFLLGEGAAVLVLESGAHARRRGARPRARLLGAGTSLDSWKATAPHPEGRGAESSMRRALKDAGLNPGEVGHVNAHGTGTPLGDLAECRAIGRLFGSAVPVSSVKGAIGHTVAAAGAIEAVVSVLSLEQGYIPGTAGLLCPDLALGVHSLAKGQERQIDVVLSNSFGFGGQNCTLIFGSM